MKSPYKDLPKEQWETKTKDLINSHPLKNDIVDIVLSSWNAIFESNLAGFKIGKDIYPEPQIMGFFLHCLIALHINKKYPDYKVGAAKTEKDIHNVKDDSLSIEIKTSSHKSQIFANRSYAQPQVGNEKKGKDGYYIAVNFEKFNPLAMHVRPNITKVRFGYLEHSDWIAQGAATGQQARLEHSAYTSKLITLYSKDKTKK